MFVLSIFIEDNYLRFQQLDPHLNSNFIKFFEILKRLPIELQMLVCLRTVGLKSTFIHTKTIQSSFHKLLESF